MTSDRISNEPAFVANQEWSYRTRLVDVGSTLFIGAIQDHPRMGRVVHIAVRNVRITDPTNPEETITEIGHMPISEVRLAESVIELIGVESPPISIREGIVGWERASGGVFTVSVAEAVELMAQVLARGTNVK